MKNKMSWGRDGSGPDLVEVETDCHTGALVE